MSAGVRLALLLQLGDVSIPSISVPGSDLIGSDLTRALRDGWLAALEAKKRCSCCMLDS